MNQEYRSDREYSLLEVLKLNLKKWWIAALLALVFAAVLGGYKAKTLAGYVDNEVYQDKIQAAASLMVREFTKGTTVERGNDVIKIADSSSVYDEFCKSTGLTLTQAEYKDMFEGEQSEASDIVTFYVTFPYTSGNFSIQDEKEALTFLNGVLDAVDVVLEDLMGKECVSVVDASHITREMEKQTVFTISQSDYRKAVFKAVTAGILLGILVEVVCYTFWLMLYKKPKNANEVQECLNAPVLDVFKQAQEDEERYKKLALFLDGGEKGNVVGCMEIGENNDNTALKLAMCYANQQKKTLYIDLKDAGESRHSVSAYVFEGKPLETEQMSPYLFVLHRNKKEEKGLDLVGNKRFQELFDKLAAEYEYVVFNTGNAADSAEGFLVAKVCDKMLAVCSRRKVKNETLYMVRNTAEMNKIQLDGVLVYDI